MAFIKKIDGYFASALLFAMVALVTLQVYMRYISGNSLAWSEELTSWCFLWMAWLGLSAVYGDEGHISVGVKRTAWPALNKSIHVFSNLVQLVFFLAVAYYTFQTITKPYILNQKSVVLSLPVWILYASIITGSSIAVFRLIINTLNYKNAPLENEE